MITLVKVNILTDDEAVPSELREKVAEMLRTLIQDDPEGVDHAKVSLEWKHSVMNRDYMASLPPTAHAERITLARKAEPKSAARTATPRRARR